MPINRTGTMGGAYSPQPQTKATGDSQQEAELLIPGDGTIGNGANHFPICQQTFTLMKATAAAIVLAAPSALQAGTVINITSGTAVAHVVTATGLVQDGVTGGAKTTLTFGAFVGASITLVASQQKWNVLGKNVVVIT